MKAYWKDPQSEEEWSEILTVLEDRGDRVLVVSSYTKWMNPTPTYVYNKSDLRIEE